MSVEHKNIESMLVSSEPYIYETEINGLLVVSRPYNFDQRGSFQEMVRVPDISFVLGNVDIKQSQVSISNSGVLRGIHAENHLKIITPLSGKYFQVFVDLRVNSPTFKKWIGIDVDNTEARRLSTFVVSPGIGNAFYVYEGPLTYNYMTTSLYDPKQSGRGVKYDDPEIGILWPTANPTISERDLLMPSLKEYQEKFQV